LAVARSIFRHIGFFSLPDARTILAFLSRNFMAIPQQFDTVFQAEKVEFRLGVDKIQIFNNFIFYAALQ
jgi:hypothetical protein